MGSTKTIKGVQWFFLRNLIPFLLYTHFIQPILKEKCLSCHNPNKKKGGFNLNSLDSLLAGGENGDVVVSGKPLKSEMLRRITLNPSSSKYMPPSGTPMSYNEIKLLEYWIRSGLSENP